MVARTHGEDGAIKLDRDIGLGAKIFLAIALVVVAALGGALVLIQRGADRAADVAVNRALDATQAAIRDALNTRSTGLLRVTQGLAQVPTYVSRVDEAIRNDDRSALLDQADEFRDQLGASWTLITDDRGVLRAWTLDRDLFDEDFSTGSLIGLALGGEATRGVWIEASAGGDEVYQAVGVPIFDPGRATIRGVLVAGLAVDDAFTAELKAHTDSEVAFFALDTTGGALVTVSTVPADDINEALAAVDLETALAAEMDHDRVFMQGDAGRLVGVVGPLSSAAGFPLGGYIGFRSWDRELAAYTQLQDTVVFVFVGALLLALLASFVLARQIIQPVKRLVELTRRVGEGQYNGTIEIQSRDEIGELAASFQHMVHNLRAKEEVVEYLSRPAGAVTPPARVAPPVGSGDAQPNDAPLAPGYVLDDRYEIEELLGVGGMGIVYRATDRELHEVVAVKTLKPDQIAGEDPSLLTRFKQEIRLARRITHRNVVRTYDLGEVDGTYYITMEYVEGTTLKELIAQRGSLPMGVTVTIGKQLCRALEVAHEAGVIHRDIKPQNLVVDPGGFLKVMDFGIARVAGGRGPAGDGLTATGVPVGTPEYMAPEQLLGKEIDARADLYGVGAVLFECVTGRPVFEAPTLAAVMACHLNDEAPDPRSTNPDVPESLARVILKALTKTPESRWQSASELHRALDEIDTTV